MQNDKSRKKITKNHKKSHKMIETHQYYQYIKSQLKRYKKSHRMIETHQYYRYIKLQLKISMRNGKSRKKIKKKKSHGTNGKLSIAEIVNR